MERKEKILGVEGGGTKTAWVLVERTGAGGADPGSQLRILDQGRLPPSNVRLETPDRLRAIFCELPREIDRAGIFLAGCGTAEDRQSLSRDRKSTRLNSSHVSISYAVFCLKKK